MNELIKKEQLSGTQKVIVGDKYNDLVLKTLGRVYIQTGSKMTLLTDLIKTIDKSSSNITDNSIIVINTTDELNTLKYPGDGKFIFIKSSQNLYITFGNTFVPIIAKNEAEVNWENLNKVFVNIQGDSMTGPLEVPLLKSDKIINENQVIINELDNAPLVVASKKIVNNLNCEFINGYSSSEIAKIYENEKIYGLWEFLSKVDFHADLAVGGSIYSRSGFASGFLGYGWMLDASDNTLTVDHLVVRKTMNVYELVVNKISATNGSLWVTDSAKIETIITLMDVKKLEDGSIRYINSITGTMYNTSTECINSFTEKLESDELNKNSNILVAVPGTSTFQNNTRYLYSHYFNGDIYKILLDDENAKYCPFRVNDILRCQRFYNNRINYYDAIVTNVNYQLDDVTLDNYIIIRLCLLETDIKENNPEYNSTRELAFPEEGDGLVRVGNISDERRQGAVYITSSDDKSPYIDICNEMNRPDFSVVLSYYSGRTLKYHKPSMVRLGRIDGIRDPAFGVNQPSGMGMVAENVFLKGRFVQVEGDKEYYIPVFKEEWNSTTSYYYYDYVTYNKKAYLCVFNELSNGSLQPVIGISPDSPENSNNRYWRLYIEGVQGDKGDKGETGETGPQGPSGPNGEDGPTGPGLMFSGEWKGNVTYLLRSDNRTIVTRTSGNTSTYYQTKITKEVDLGGLNPNPDGTYNIPNVTPESAEGLKYWKTFGGQFTSIATDTLFAREANVANFIFRDEKLVSQSTSIIDGKTVHNLTLDGKTGKLEAYDGVFRGAIQALTGSFGNSSTGELFEIQGNSIVGKSLEEGKLYDRIIITTDPLPPLNTIMEGINHTKLNVNNSIYNYSDKIGYTPTHDFQYESAQLFRGFNHSKTQSSDVFTIPSGTMLNSRILKIKTTGIIDRSHNGGNGCNQQVHRMNNTVSLYKKTTSGQFSLFKRLDKGDNYINVLVGEQFQLRMDCSIYYDPEYFNRYPCGPNSYYLYISGQGELDTVYENWPSFNNGTIQYSPIFIPDGTINLGSSEISVFDGLARTIVASDGFCSYWGPNTYFYFSKSEGLKQATQPVGYEAPVETVMNTKIEQEQIIKEVPKILTYQDIQDGNYPEGVVYTDKLGYLKVKQ